MSTQFYTNKVLELFHGELVSKKIGLSTHCKKSATVACEAASVAVTFSKLVSDKLHKNQRDTVKNKRNFKMTTHRHSGRILLVLRTH